MSFSRTPNSKRFEVVAYPNGARKTIASLFVRSGDPVETFSTARFQARTREQFVDVEHNGRIVATVGPDGNLYQRSAQDD